MSKKFHLWNVLVIDSLPWQKIFFFLQLLLGNEFIPSVQKYNLLNVVLEMIIIFNAECSSHGNYGNKMIRENNSLLSIFMTVRFLSFFCSVTL